MRIKHKFPIIIFLLVFAVLLLFFQMYTSSGKTATVKVLIFNDGTVVVNGSIVEPGKYQQAINKHLTKDAEIWYWLENPYGVPKGVSYDVSSIIIELTTDHTVKLYSDGDFKGDYQLISVHDEDF